MSEIVQTRRGLLGWLGVGAAAAAAPGLVSGLAKDDVLGIALPSVSHPVAPELKLITEGVHPKSLWPGIGQWFEREHFQGDYASVEWSEAQDPGRW